MGGQHWLGVELSAARSELSARGESEPHAALQQTPKPIRK